MTGVAVILPIFVCVVLPVCIVLIIGLVRRNETNRRAEVMLKAIEKGQTIDPKLFETPRKNKTIKQDLLEKLNGACITSLMGAAFLALYFVEGNNGLFGAGAFFPFAAAAMLAVGIGLFISYFAGTKMLAKEIEVEEKHLSENE